jgi:hypothetical protein
MKIPILLEPVADNGYRATSGPPLALSAEGATPDEALAKLRECTAERLRTGTRLVTLDVPVTEENPWVKYAGMFKDNPMFDEVVEIMKENRRKDEADPDYL